MTIELSERLQDALAGLAEQLGISVGQLWQWLQGSGVGAYARAKVAQLGATAAVGAVLVVLGVAALVWTARRIGEMEDRDMYLVPLALLLIVGSAIGVIFLASTVSALCGWIASPEGMVMDMILHGLR